MKYVGFRSLAKQWMPVYLCFMVLGNLKKSSRGIVSLFALAAVAGGGLCACNSDVQDAEAKAVVKSIEFAETDPLLGEPFKVYPIQGKYLATLIQYPSDSSRAYKGIALYVHGYNDYYFNRELAQKTDSAGYAFFAIDLHFYGRSLRSDDDPFRAREIQEYFPEIDSALSMAQTLSRPLMTPSDSTKTRLPEYLIGHSTGGLIVPLYAESHRHGQDLAAIVLSSPFLEMNLQWFARNVLVPVASAVGSLIPDFPVNDLPNPNYSYSLRKDYHGEWEYDTRLKPPISPMKDLGWIRAIHAAHEQVQEGLNVETPILLMHSDCSIRAKEWTEEYTHCDGVLDIDNMKKLGHRLGPHVTFDEIQGGLHDLYLSAKDAREKAYRETFEFFDKHSTL